MHVECAPLAGYTNAEFRRVLASHGAKVLWTEMVSAAAIFFGNKKTLKLLERASGGVSPQKSSFATQPADNLLAKYTPPPNPHTVREVVQLFGHKPEQFEFAIKSGLLDGFDEININMGCPANKIVKNGEGVGLMKNMELARQIIETCVKAAGETCSENAATLQMFSSQVPPAAISVKMRLGMKAGFDFVSFAKMCESAGASRLIVHGRYGEQGYSGKADWNAIGEIVRAVKIPVIANGDIRNIDDARKCIEITGAAGVMVGRVLLPLYRKYFPQNLRILRGEKICRDGGVNPCINNIDELFRHS